MHEWNTALHWEDSARGNDARAFHAVGVPALGAVRGTLCAAADAACEELTGRRIASLFHCERLGLGAGWCNTPSPVLRGAGNEPSQGRDVVAPPGNQAANGYLIRKNLPPGSRTEPLTGAP